VLNNEVGDDRSLGRRVVADDTLRVREAVGLRVTRAK
jgi:hypothetical protein